MRRLLPILLACALPTALVAAAASEAAPRRPSPTLGRTATFMLELTARTEIRWTYTLPKRKRSCYEHVASSHRGSDSWSARTRAPVRVTAIDLGSLVMIGGDPTDPDASKQIATSGRWTRETSGSDVSTPGECGGGTSVRRADSSDCGTQLPEQVAGLVVSRGYAILSVRGGTNLPRRFERCRLLFPKGMLPGEFPTDDDDGVMMRFDRSRLFGGERVIRLRGSRTFRAPKAAHMSVTGTASWSATLRRIRR